jgi:small subunit ribosomal protein S17
MTKTKKQVLGYLAPKRAEDSKYHDKNCPFTGTLPVKKEIIKGVMVKKDSSKSATIMWERSVYVPKYERYQVKKSRLRVHNPPCIDAEVGQNVVVARTRPISKTKNHVIISIIENESSKK